MIAGRSIWRDRCSMTQEGTGSNHGADDGEVSAATAIAIANAVAIALAAERAARDEAIAQAVAREREARDDALAAQEHRAVAATINLATEIHRRRWAGVPGRLGALAWTLLPRPGMVAVGLVGLLTLALTAVQVLLFFQQNQLLEAQNARVDIQTAVAEAGRRSTLAAEARLVIAEMIRERDTIALMVPDPFPADEYLVNECRPPELETAILERCWRLYRKKVVAGRRTQLPVPDRCREKELGGGWEVRRGCPIELPPSYPDEPAFVEDSIDLPLFPVAASFYPSDGLSIRLASILNALTPHRAVEVTSRGEECSWRTTSNPALRLARAATSAGGESRREKVASWDEAMAVAIDDILHEVWSQHRATSGGQRGAAPDRTYLLSVAADVAARFQTALQRARLTSEQRTVAPAPTVRFACAESSPERGDILQAMVDARLHPDSVVGRGGSFEGALFSGLRLQRQALEGISLRGARLAAGEMHSMVRSLLIDVTAEGADFTQLVPIDTRSTGIGWPTVPPVIAFDLKNAERQMSLLGDLCRAGREDASFRRGESACVAGLLSVSNTNRDAHWCEIVRGANVAAQISEDDISQYIRDITALVFVADQLGDSEYGILIRPDEMPPEMKSGVISRRSDLGREAAIHLVRPKDCPR
jgi:hypothetical protein